MYLANAFHSCRRGDQVLLGQVQQNLKKLFRFAACNRLFCLFLTIPYWFSSLSYYLYNLATSVLNISLHDPFVLSIAMVSTRVNSVLATKLFLCVCSQKKIWKQCSISGLVIYCNRRNFRTRKNFVLQRSQAFVRDKFSYSKGRCRIHCHTCMVFVCY